MKMTVIEALVQLRDDIKLWVANNLRTKVDKEIGKGLSSNDYTDAEKEKVANAISADDDVVFVFDGGKAPTEEPEEVVEEPAETIEEPEEA